MSNSELGTVEQIQRIHKNSARRENRGAYSVHFHALLELKFKKDLFYFLLAILYIYDILCIVKCSLTYRLLYKKKVVMRL